MNPTPITPQSAKARRRALGLTQTEMGEAINETYRHYGVEAARLDATRVYKVESGNPEAGTLLAYSLTLQRLEQGK